MNGETSPAVKLGGAVITHVMTELEIICLPANLPQFIEVDLAKMVAGESVHLESITLPKGVTFAAHGGDTNPALAVALVKGGAKSAGGADDDAEGEEASSDDA